MYNESKFYEKWRKHSNISLFPFLFQKCGFALTNWVLWPTITTSSSKSPTLLVGLCSCASFTVKQFLPLFWGDSTYLCTQLRDLRESLLVSKTRLGTLSKTSQCTLSVLPLFFPFFLFPPHKYLLRKPATCQRLFSAQGRAGFMGPWAQQSPAIGLMLCCCCLKILNNLFLTKRAPFLFCIGSDKLCYCSCTGVMNKADPNSYPPRVHILVLTVHWLASEHMLVFAYLPASHPSYTVSSLRTNVPFQHHLWHILYCLPAFTH